MNEGKYDHILNFDGTVNAERYNTEQSNSWLNVLAILPGALVWLTLLLT